MDKMMRDKIAKCKTVKEVLDLAKANNYDITPSQAEKIFNESRNNATKLSDEELNNVAGGWMDNCSHSNAYDLVKFPSEAEVTYIFEIGQKVQVFTGNGNNTRERKIDARTAMSFHDSDGTLYWCDEYHFTDSVDNLTGWYPRRCIEKPR